ncbi:MAG: hypothetical protein ABI396_16485 [Ktedonobacteraceae bacterium]
MPRDERKHQKALMKKRSKQKAGSSHRSPQEAAMPLSKQTIIHRARSYPIEECLISSDWERGSGLVQIVLARKQPDGDICFGVYLVDKYCLGLKNTFANAGFSRTRYEDEIHGRIFEKVEAVTSPLELAHQMIYASIDYAAQFGFEPQADFALSQFLLAPRGELKEPYKLTFGLNGKPFFVAGPRDNALRIIRQLEKTAGPGNFDYLAMTPPGF